MNTSSPTTSTWPLFSMGKILAIWLTGETYPPKTLPGPEETMVAPSSSLSSMSRIAKINMRKSLQQAPSISTSPQLHTFERRLQAIRAGRPLKVLNTDFGWTMEPVLHNLVTLVFYGYKYPIDSTTPKEYRYAALVLDGYRDTPCSVFSYCGLHTGEVRSVDGIYKIGTTDRETPRRTAFLGELDKIRVNHPEGYRYNRQQPLKDVQTVKREIADLLIKYHR